MASSNGEGETRVLIAHCANDIDRNSCSSEGLDNCLLSLRHLRSGEPTSYVLINGTLQEIHWFKQPFGSWFIGDYVCEDGGLYVATQIDPVFIFLPVFEEARMKRGDDLGVFRSFRNLDEMTCFLLLRNPCSNEFSLLGEYLKKGDPWLKQLYEHLWLILEETDKKAWIIEPVSFVSEVAPVQNGKGKNTTGNKKQPKKIKVETGSKNIKECSVEHQRKASDVCLRACKRERGEQQQ